MSDRERSELTDATARAGSTGIVLVTLDSSVMNVSIATVAKDFFSRRIPTRQPGASTANE
jgi:hypothetical protein